MRADVPPPSLSARHHLIADLGDAAASDFCIVNNIDDGVRSGSPWGSWKVRRMGPGHRATAPTDKIAKFDFCEVETPDKLIRLPPATDFLPNGGEGRHQKCVRSNRAEFYFVSSSVALREAAMLWVIRSVHAACSLCNRSSVVFARAETSTVPFESTSRRAEFALPRHRKWPPKVLTSIQQSVRQRTLWLLLVKSVFRNWGQKP